MTKWQVQRIKNIYHWWVSVLMVMRYGYPAKNLTVIGVTGTDGKTTTCTLIYEMLKAAGVKTALISTVEARIGEEAIDTGLHTTNPDARLLQPLLRKIADTGITHVVLEVTSHGLDQNRVVGCNFKIGVLTNITHEHLDAFGDMERYREVKAKLFGQVDWAVLNKDDQAFEYMKSKCKRGCQIIPYGKTKIKEISPDLAGDYNKYNIAAAEATAKILGVEKGISEGVVKNFKGVKGRREEIKAGQKFRVIVDFAHTPNAIEKVAEQLHKELPVGKKLTVVFGCVGERDESKRPMMGKAAARWADRVIVTADDPRWDDMGGLFAMATADLSSEEQEKTLREDDRRKAIEMALAGAGPGDIVLLAGKGHEKSLAIKGEEVPWSDQEVAKEVLEELVK